MKSLLPLNIRHKTGFKTLSTLPSVPNHIPKTLGFGGRWWQVEVFIKFQNERLTIYVGACASGKSLMCITCAADSTIKSDWTRRHIITVPQRDIGNGFSENKHQKLKMPNDEKTYDWKTCANLCGEEEAKSVSRAYDFITSNFSGESAKEINNAGGTTVIMTKHALIMLWKKMSHEEKLHTVSNITLWDDESHHIAGVTEEDDLVETNAFGEIVKFFIDNGGSVHLFTATYLRNDGLPILSKEYMDLFTIYRLSDHDYLETTGIQEMIHDFVPFDDSEDLLKQIIKNIKREKKEKHIIYVPSEGRGYFRDCDKWSFIHNLRTKLEKMGLNGLDLVTPKRQDIDKRRLFDEIKTFDFIIACGMAKEGSDWPECSRVHNTVLDRGLQVTKQKNGRTWRQSSDKTIVKSITYVQNCENWKNEETREIFSDRLLASCVSTSLIDDIFYPIYISCKKEDNKKKIKHSDEQEGKVTLDEILKENLQEIRSKIMKTWLGSRNEDKTETIIKEKIGDIISDYVDDMHTDVDHADLVDALTEDLVRRVQPKNYRLRTEPVVLKAKEINWDKLLRNGTPFQAKLTASHLKELDGKIREMYCNQNDYKWEDMCILLEAYYSREGHSSVPQTHIENGKPLGDWVSRQRAYEKDLSKSRKNMLNKLGFIWNMFDNLWIKQYNNLKQYFEKNNTTKIPTGCIIDGINLYSWSNVQRNLKNQNNLSKEKEEYLNKIGFVWSPVDDRWMQYYKCLKKYYNREGHTLVPMNHIEDGKKLGKWASQQRYRKQKLSESRINLLDEIKFIWNPDVKNTAWMKNYNILKKIYLREKHCRVTRFHKEDNINIGFWVANQRRRKKIGNLSIKEIELLDNIKFEWNP